MNARKRALLKSGSLTAMALACGALAALGSLHVIPMFGGQVKTVCLVAVAITMLSQGAWLFPRNYNDCLIIRREALISGSLILFSAAALILALAFTGCSPAGVKPHTQQTMNFTAANRQSLGACSALDVSSGIAARLLW